MLTNILIGLAVLIVALLGYAATKPDTFHYEQSIDIQAPPAKIFGWLNSPRKSMEWSPWEKLDPDMARTFSGPESGAGAVYEWSGDNKVGAGKMTYTEVVPNEKLVMDLAFIKPMEGRATSEIILQDKGDVTQVTWSMHGPNNYMGKLMSVFINCEKMVEEQYAAGLANLKALAEK